MNDSYRYLETIIVLMFIIEGYLLQAAFDSYIGRIKIISGGISIWNSFHAYAIVTRVVYT